MKLHHLGMAVRDLSDARHYMERLGATVITEVFNDETQNVKVQFIDLGGQPIELVAPLGTPSPVDGVLKSGRRWYHLCYEVADLDDTIKEWSSRGAILLGRPVPAVAFQGRRIVFMMTDQQDLFEFLEIT